MTVPAMRYSSSKHDNDPDVRSTLSSCHRLLLFSTARDEQRDEDEADYRFWRGKRRATCLVLSIARYVFQKDSGRPEEGVS